MRAKLSGLKRAACAVLRNEGTAADVPAVSAEAIGSLQAHAPPKVDADVTRRPSKSQ